MLNREILFWVFAIALAYVYAGYPGLVWLWATLSPSPRPARRSGPEPRVSVVVVAHNEAARLGRP